MDFGDSFLRAHMQWSYRQIWHSSLLYFVLCLFIMVKNQSVCFSEIPQVGENFQIMVLEWYMAMKVLFW